MQYVDRCSTSQLQEAIEWGQSYKYVEHIINPKNFNLFFAYPKGKNIKWSISNNLQVSACIYVGT